MAVTTESITLHRTVEGAPDVVVKPRHGPGDIPGVRRLLGDLEPVDLDSSELDDLTPRPAASTAEASDILMLDHTPLAPTVRESAYDEGVGGYER